MENKSICNMKIQQENYFSGYSEQLKKDMSEVRENFIFSGDE